MRTAGETVRFAQLLYAQLRPEARIKVRGTVFPEASIAEAEGLGYERRLLCEALMGCAMVDILDWPK